MKDDRLGISVQEVRYVAMPAILNQSAITSLWDNMLESIQFGGFYMPFWQRFLILLVAILLVGFLVDLIWHNIFGFALPAYVTGVIGGLTAVPLWDLLKRIQTK